VTTREPEFSADDVAALLASRRAEAEPRNAYGVLVADATAKENQYAFVAEPITDFALLAVERAREKIKKDFPETDMSAWMWRVTRPR
jgi:hypothetical protein